MMDDVMIRFLTSIGLDPEEFDISFDACYRDPLMKKTIVMDIVKDSSWTYKQYLNFLEGIHKIVYPFRMSFSYRQRFSSKEIEEFFNDFYFDNKRSNFKGKLHLDNDCLIFQFSSNEEQEKEKIIISEFEKLLKFLNVVLTFVYRFDEDNLIQEKIMEDDESLIENDDSEKIKNNEIYRAEQIYLNNYAQMLSDRKDHIEHMKLYKRGDYQVFDDLSDIPSSKIINVEVSGEVFQCKSRLNKNEKFTIVAGLGKDNKSAITFKATETLNSIKKEDLLKIDIDTNRKDGPAFIKVKIRGSCHIDEKSKEPIIQVHYLDILPDENDRSDDEPEKRVELHLHTNMSQADAINPIEDYVAMAAKMGHRAIAVTDHGVAQSFPYAQKAGLKYGVKILYGCEFYMVDRKLNYIFNPTDVPLSNATYVCLDLETSGLSARYDKIIEFGAVKIQNDIVRDRIDILINPELQISDATMGLTHISNDDLKDKPTFKDAWPRIKEFIGDAIVVTHNTAFDISFLNGELERIGEDVIRNPVIDTLSLSRYLFSTAKTHRLGDLSKRLGLNVYDDDKAHRADFDAEVLGDVWCKLLGDFRVKNPNMLHSDLAKFETSVDMFKHMRPSHVTVYAKNKQGLFDLFRLITMSHLDYLADIPKIPRDEIAKVRENLIIGSSCFNGEVFETAHTKTRKILEKTMKFYDFIELQPLCQYDYLLNSYRYSKVSYRTGADGKPEGFRSAIFMPDFKSKDDLIRTIKDIVEIADNLNIPVCATGDVHYLNKKDKVLREIYIATDGINHRPHPLCTNPRGQIDNHIYRESGDQYYMNTKEMLDAFDYFPIERAKEFVIYNPNKIADMCEELHPVKDSLFTPKIENADQMLRDLAYSKAKELYGDPLPIEIVNRLEKEFSRIISKKASYSVNYLLAKDIVNRANSDGYFVGSRGSVGSSFVATLLGITEVNPLPPHYYCSHCKKIYWKDDSEYISGIDLPNLKCPVCGNELKKDGQNIPFETFLGFDEKSTKVPDIDLNFADVYQPRAHNFLRETFGRNHVFRAGTIGTYKEKMSFAAVKDYFVRSLHKKNGEISRTYQTYLAIRSSGVKKTTGQHPGGIILIPKEFDVHDFTPIQHPADKIDADWETTHFEFSTIHDTVLKLDLLGHKDPLALKMMGELTGVDFLKIPLDDKKVLSLFTSVDALNFEDNYLNLSLGTLGLPEFGTNFVQGVLLTAKPKTFNDLLVVSGITHGTDVWVGNAETLLSTNVAKGLEDIIGCRDDIMLYLMKKGVANDIAFKVMEDVRKGKGLKPEYLNEMKAHDVPDFYIDSCQKIKYLFPRAHATAYVTQAVRVGYFKIYYPLEFYAVFFSIRSRQFDIDSMIKGKTAMEEKYEELKKQNKEGKISNKDSDVLDMLEMAVEMACRGYKFANVDINKSLASDFLVDKENKALIPPFIVLSSLGDAVAEGIIKARNERPFTSVEDFSTRSPVTKTQLAKLKDLGCFNNLKDSDDISLFDFLN